MGAPGALSNRTPGNEQAARRTDTQVVTALANASIFSLCSKRELKLVAKLAKRRSVPAGTTLMAEGDAGDTMIVVLAGGADVRKNGRKIAELGSGDVAGEMSLLGKAPRNATVVTRTEADLAIIGRREFFRLLEDAPGFSRKLLEALASRVREMDRRVVG